ncbi:MAG TPA: hypothetical protein VKO42_04420 [Patescibacteria group bacterium]|nr:hypothetical protein [Patescibacteria group bacterium]
MANKEQKYETPQPEKIKTEKGTFWGLVGGGLIGILGFWISDDQLFILSPFILGLLGFLVGFVWDRKVDADKRKQIFKNKI